MDNEREVQKRLIDRMARAPELTLVRLAALVIQAAAVSAAFTNDDSCVTPQQIARSLAERLPGDEQWMTNDHFRVVIWSLSEDEDLLSDLLSVADRYDNLARPDGELPTG